MLNAIARMLTRIADALRGRPAKANPLPGELAPGESFVNVRPLDPPNPVRLRSQTEERPALPPKPDGKEVAGAARRYASQASRPEEFVRKLHNKDFDGALMDIRHLYRLLKSWAASDEKGLNASDPFGMAHVISEKDPWRYLRRADQVYNNYRENGNEMFGRAKKLAAASQNTKDIAEALLWRVNLLGKALRGENF